MEATGPEHLLGVNRTCQFDPSNDMLLRNARCCRCESLRMRVGHALGQVDRKESKHVRVGGQVDLCSGRDGILGFWGEMGGLCLNVNCGC